MRSADINAVTVVIPTIAPRAALLHRAVNSVYAQDAVSKSIIVAEDRDRQGAAYTRHRGLMQVDTPWTAFLDDDDELMPSHLRTLIWWANHCDADYVFSWFMIKDAYGVEHPEWDPFPQHFGKPWDNEVPRQTTITVLVRTELAQSVGFLHPNEAGEIDGNTWGEDYQFTLGCVRAGAKILHVPMRTWFWYHHGANTSGRPDRW